MTVILRSSQTMIMMLIGFLTTTATLVLVLTNIAGVSGNFQFGQEGKFCKPYKCPKAGQVPVPKQPLKFESVGCSGMGGMMMMLKADNGADESPTAICCDQRIACLQTCGSVKMVCDEEFFKCTKDRCQESSGGDRTKEDECNAQTQIYQLMVNLDCKMYNEGQQSSCECVDEDEAEEKRLAVVTTFYETYSPESVDKAAGLVKKADTSKKMAGLLTKLIKKYPQSVKRVKSDNQEMYEKIVKESAAKREEKEHAENVEKSGDDDEEELLEEEARIEL